MRFSQYLNQFAALIGLRVFRRNHPALRYAALLPNHGLAYALHRAFDDLRGLRFIQVGANDGQMSDPIAPLIKSFHWQGALIEPRPRFAGQLRRLHGHNAALRIVQAAIAAQRGRQILYYLDASAPGLPEFANGLATLERTRIETACRDLQLPADRIREETIETLRWQDLEPDTLLAETDVLVTDVEGMDIPLLRLWDWTRALPGVVHFEHSCAPREDYHAFLEELCTRGYEIVTEGGDTTAFRPAQT